MNLQNIEINGQNYQYDLNAFPELGDVYVIDDRDITKLGDIKSLFEDFENYIETMNSSEKIEITQANKVIIDIGAKVDSEAIAKGEIGIKFTKENSIVCAFQVSNYSNLNILNLDSRILEHFLKEKKYAGPIKRKKVYFVSSVLKCKSGTFLFSQNKDNNVILEVENNKSVNGLLDAASGKISIKKQKSNVIKQIFDKPKNIFFKAHALKKNGTWELIG